MQYEKLKEEANQLVEKAVRQCEEIQKRIERYQKEKQKEIVMIEEEDEIEEGRKNKDKKQLSKQQREAYKETIAYEKKERLEKCKQKITEIEEKVKKQEEDYRGTIDAQDKLIGNIIRAMETLKKKRLHQELINNMRSMEQEKMTNTKVQGINNKYEEEMKRQKQQKNQQEYNQEQEGTGGGTNQEEEARPPFEGMSTTTTTQKNTMMQKDTMTQSMYYKPKKSLHDFVNKQNIETLFQQAQDAKQNIETMNGMSQHLYKSTIDQYDNVKKSMERVEEQLQEKETDIISINEETLMSKFNDMQTIMLKMKTYLHSLDVVQSMPLFSSFNMNTLEKQLDDMKAEAPRIDKLAEDIRQMTGPLEVMSKGHMDDAMHQLTRDMDTLQAATESIENSFYALVEQYNKAKYESETIELFTEIRDLTRWYEYFPIAYDNLLVEIDRRNKAQQAFQERVQAMNQELKATYDDEQQSRMQFYEQFGQFLPATLCPQLGKPADQAYIQVQNTSDPPLPPVTLTDAQRQQIHEHTMKMTQYEQE